MTEPLMNMCGRGGASTHESDSSELNRGRELLARVGALFESQRVELYSSSSEGMHLSMWWAALGFEDVGGRAGAPISPAWFPWSLGNIRQANEIFVCNAGQLPLRPGGTLRVADLRMGSSLYLPVLGTDAKHDLPVTIGGVCVYWHEERSEWSEEKTRRAIEWAREALDEDVLLGSPSTLRLSP